MGAEIILHIGAGKAGSTAIQAFLKRNYAALAKHGVIVLDRDFGSGGVVTGNHVWETQKHLVAKTGPELMDALDAAAEKAGDGRRLLVSAENLSNLGAHRIFAGLRDRRNVSAILYVRRQDEFLTSAWQQWYCKVEPDLHAWIIKALGQFGLWWRVILDWESVLGEGAVTVRVFEPGAMVDGDLVSDFLNVLGLGEQRAKFERDVGRANASLTDIITPLVTGNRSLFRDQHDNDYFKFVEEVTGQAYVGGPKVSLITREQREAIMAFYSNMNQRICTRFFPGRPQLFAPIDHSKYEYLSEREMQGRQMQFLNELIFRTYQKCQTGR